LASLAVIFQTTKIAEVNAKSAKGDAKIAENFCSLLCVLGAYLASLAVNFQTTKSAEDNAKSAEVNAKSAKGDAKIAEVNAKSAEDYAKSAEVFLFFALRPWRLIFKPQRSRRFFTSGHLFCGIVLDYSDIVAGYMLVGVQYQLNIGFICVIQLNGVVV
jgi:hypothetical protein